MDVVRVDKVNYDDVSEGVRRFCAEKLYELEKSLRPMVDGSFGEVLPGHLAGYLAALRQLGKLYQVEKPPRDLQDLVPMEKVQQMLAGMQETHRRELETAVAQTEVRVRAEVTAGTRISIETAKHQVAGRLLELEARQDDPTSGS